MLKRISGLLLIGLILIFGGCASLSGSGGASLKEPKLIWNVSYIRGLVLAKEALSPESIQFGNALMRNDSAQLIGNYPDGKTVEIVISKLKPSESSLVLRVGNSPTAQEEAKRLLELIAQYAQQRKQSL